MIEPIRRLQKKVIRIIPFLKFKEHTGPLFKEPLISPLDDINKEAIALFMFRYFNNNLPSSFIIIHQTHHEKSGWSRAFNQFTIACELDMINAISAADIAFIMSSSTSAWLPSPLECSPQKQNG